MFAILIIDNDKIFADELRRSFSLEGYKVDIAATAGDGLMQLQKHNYDVLILDSDLPDMAGSEVCSRVSQSNLKLPILMLGSSVGVEDTVRGLDSGAQDFVNKTCQMPEVSARVRSLLRRYSKQGIPAPVVPLPVNVNVPIS